MRMTEVKKVNLSFVSTSDKYSISIGTGLINRINDFIDTGKYTKIVFLTDSNVAQYYLEAAQLNLAKESESIVIKQGEVQKNLATIDYIWDQMLQFEMDRKSLLINLGGGVIGDLGGFAASTYMRGIDFINMPTTLLAAADASIGGKTGFNFADLKNMIGSFAQPKAVIIDIDTFNTLDERTYNEGFAEIIKHAAVFDTNYFSELEDTLPKPDLEKLVNILQKSSQLKADIVMADEKESDNRKFLNFGHTIGHAIESLSHEQDQPLLHGEAIAIGMIAEARLGELNNITKPGTSDRIKTLLRKANLPIELPDWIEIEQFNDKIIKDKKNQNQKINWVMLNAIGSAQIDVLIDQNQLLKLYN